MRGQTLGLRIVPVILAAYVALGTSAVQPQAMAPDAPLSALWEQPHNLRDQDLFNGPWGAERAPDPDAVYTFLRLKTTGTNPGVVVQDPAGREWHVKQPPHNDHGEEGPVEVTVSRVLSAIGYHQPPVYFLPSFMMRDATGTRREIDLVPPAAPPPTAPKPAEPRAELPAPVCPMGLVSTETPDSPEPPAPGTSPLDSGLEQLAREFRTGEGGQP